MTVTTNYTVDLGDPRVRSLLDAGVSNGKRELVQLSGDVPDPLGDMPGVGVARGMQSTVTLNANKREVLVVYRDMFLTADVYALPGEPIKVHMICPRCHKPLQVSGDRKRIEYDPSERRVAPEALASGKPEIARLADSGALSIEPFECTWELGDDVHVRGIVQSGTSLCRLRIGIENNRAKDA